MAQELTGLEYLKEKEIKNKNALFRRKDSIFIPPLPTMIRLKIHPNTTPVQKKSP